MRERKKREREKRRREGYRDRQREPHKVYYHYSLKQRPRRSRCFSDYDVTMFNDRKACTAALQPAGSAKDGTPGKYQRETYAQS